MNTARRRFLQVGAAGSVVLVAAYALHRSTPPSGDGSLALKALDSQSAALIAALAPVILDGALPEEPDSRAVAIHEVVDAFDRGLAGMSPAVQEELQQLLSLLTLAPTRILVAGIWRPWHLVAPDDVAAFLTRWRTSRFDLLRSGYQALTQLLQACWYGNPLAWGAIGFALPASAREMGL